MQGFGQNSFKKFALKHIKIRCVDLFMVILSFSAALILGLPNEVNDQIWQKREK